MMPRSARNRSERDLERTNIHVFIRNPELNPLRPVAQPAGQEGSFNFSDQEHRGGGRDKNSQASRPSKSIEE